MGQGASLGFWWGGHFPWGFLLGVATVLVSVEVSLLHSVWLACEGTSLHSFALYFWHKAFVNSPQHIIKVFTLLQFLTSLSTRKIIFRNSAFLNMLSSTTRGGALSSISLTTERVPPLRILLPTFFSFFFY